MRVDLFHYDLPPELIAQTPPEERDGARLLVVGKSGLSHRRVAELAELLPEGALVVLNDTRVLPARLIAQKDTGGRVEVMLLRAMGTRTVDTEHGPVEGALWRAMGKASKALRFGSDLRVLGPDGAPTPLLVRLLGRADDGLLEVVLHTKDGAPVDEAIRAFGRMPLPPYIKREVEPADAERYQTVFARTEGAVAAPTAGLHLSRALLGRLAVRGCEIATVTLHVGLGTFQPVTTEDFDAHPMHRETYEVTRTTANAIEAARRRGSPVVAVGTTVVRALESAAGEDGVVRPTSGETQLLIQPGHRFRAVDVLLTNFHLPRSTLLALVSAFGGRERVLAAYRTAVLEQYRFFSYGDAMLLDRRELDDAETP
jgi:S-adenosylmethionine:tRNA ribosyltransferase-isomerase